MKRWTMITVKCEIHHIETIILSSDTEIVAANMNEPGLRLDLKYCTSHPS